MFNDLFMIVTHFLPHAKADDVIFSGQKQTLICKHKSVSGAENNTEKNVERMIIRTMDIDEAIKLVGEYGRVQKAVFWSMAIPQVFLAWNHLLNVFVGATPDFVCNLDDSTSVKGCSSDPLKFPCQSYSFNEKDFTSISSEVILSNFFLANELSINL